jgi:Zn-dependent peptidase ImmA (M78 family)
MNCIGARYDFAYEKACEFLLSSGICTLPLNPIEAIKQKHWGLVTYSELCFILRDGAKPEDIIKICRSKDGFTVSNGANFCIAYNDKIKIKSRIAFTLMHEAGHIMCGHFNGEGLMLVADEYKRLETEANYFASNVLAPAAVIHACGLQNAGLIQAACGISSRAAQARLDELANWKPRSIDKEIVRAFNSYIHVISRRNLLSSADVDFDKTTCE